MHQLSPFQTGNSPPAFNLGDDAEEETAPEPARAPARGTGRGGRRGGRRGRRGGGRRAASSESSVNKTAYSSEETDALAKAWVDISQDPVVNSGQKGEALWVRIANRYNEIKPPGTNERHSEMLRHHWKRVQTEIKLFQSYYIQLENTMGSGGGGQDILTNALTLFYQLKNAPFKYQSTWYLVRNTLKFLHATSTDDVAKRCKTSIDGSYSGSQSSRASAPTNEDTDDPSWAETYGAGEYRARPEGTQSARNRGKAKATECTSASTAEKREELKKLAESVELANYYEIVMKDTSGMTAKQKKNHLKFVKYIKQKFNWSDDDEDSE